MKFQKYLGILLSILFLFPLYLTSLPNYLFFDSLVELFSIVVACYIFIRVGNKMEEKICLNVLPRILKSNITTKGDRR